MKITEVVCQILARAGLGRATLLIDAAYIRSRVEEIGARLCNHCYTSPLTVAASLHWLSTCRDAFVFEDCVEDSPLRHDLTVEKVQSVGGWIDVPDRPGLGVTLDEDFVRKYLIAESW